MDEKYFAKRKSYFPPKNEISRDYGVPQKHYEHAEDNNVDEY